METVSGLRERGARDGADTPTPRRRRTAEPHPQLLEDPMDEHDDAPPTPVPPGRRLDVFA